MARDYAKTRRPERGNPRRPERDTRGQPRRQAPPRAAPGPRRGSSWRAFIAGLLSGVFLCFILYLARLPAGDEATPDPQPTAVAPVPAEPPKPRFDFYTMLPQQTIDGPLEPATVTDLPAAATQEAYLLQAGSFRQREDADRRRAELLLLGLEPRVEETDSDNGRWFRVYLGPYDSHPEMTRARSLTAAQDIDTLLLKRGTP